MLGSIINRCIVETSKLAVKLAVYCSMKKEPQSDAEMGDMSTLEGASRGPGAMTDSLSYKPSSCEEGISGDNMDMLRM